MNQPDRYSRFSLPDGKEKVEFASDSKIKNAATYTIRLEDHTLGNLIRMQLHTDEAVVFAGYRIPHPLDPLMVVRIQTTEAKLPQDAMTHALLDLKAEVAELKAQLAAVVPRPHNPHLQALPQQQGGGMHLGGGDGYMGAGGGGDMYGGGAGGGYQQAGGYGGYQ